MWARIEGNKVREVINFDPTDRFHPSLVWVECPVEVKEGYTYDGINFIPPPKKTLDEVKKNRLNYIRIKAQNYILSVYPLWYQSNVANGIYPVLVADKVKSDIASVIVASNIAEDSVSIATTINEVNAIEPVFPVIGG